jgi:hypothetical protein
MSWWDTGEGDDVIGDRPADLLTSALANLAGARGAVGEPPSLAGLLAGLGAALSGPSRQVELVAETESGPLPTGSEAEAVELMPELRKVLAEIDASYQERWERDPRPSEVARLTAFVLGPDPGRYLRAADARGLGLTAVRARVREA